MIIKTLLSQRTRAVTARSRGTDEKKHSPNKKISEQYMSIGEFLPKDFK